MSKNLPIRLLPSYMTELELARNPAVSPNSYSPILASRNQCFQPKWDRGARRFDQEEEKIGVSDDDEEHPGHATKSKPSKLKFPLGKLQTNTNFKITKPSIEP